MYTEEMNENLIKIEILAPPPSNTVYILLDRTLFWLLIVVPFSL